MLCNKNSKDSIPHARSLYLIDPSLEVTYNSYSSFEEKDRLKNIENMSYKQLQKFFPGH